jgi:hypothetical protein
MTPESKTDLSRRAVACKGWRWMGGMLIIHTPRHDGATGYVSRLPQDGYRPNPGDVPDLDDPATLGCLLALVREDLPDATVQLDGATWWVAARNGVCCGSGDTEAEALVSALEASP